MDSVATSPREIARSKPVRLGARIGLAAYGLTHVLVAWLALQLAFGGARQSADQDGAFQTLASGSAGTVLLWVLTAGFVAVALWRLEQVIWGYGYVEDTAKKLRRRVTSAAQAAVFVVLAFLAGRAAVAGDSGGGGQQQATAGVLGLPGGQLIIGAVGVGIVVVGVVKAWHAWQKRFLDDMDLPADQHLRAVVERSGQVGGIAKGVALALVGLLVILAAVQADPQEAAGLDVALRTLAAQPYGVVALVAVALGLLAYGVFSVFDARYHRV